MSASGNDIKIAISSGQVRAARALIGWSQDQLVEASGVPKRTIARMELDQGAPRRRTLAALQATLEAAGVEFIQENGGGPGVRLRKAEKEEKPKA
jgi:transcriptional regulator with XRE-family HTH domain